MRIFPVIVFALGANGIAAAACPPQGVSRVELDQLRAAKWAVADDAKRQALAIGMRACLADPDPTLRDAIAFESLQAWMRGGKLDPATLATLRSALLASLKQSDAAGFAQPFAALTLAEVARTDRIASYLSQPERSELVQAGAAYLAAVRDYRGFDEREGWRHGVAHAADLMLQLSLNVALTRKDQQAMLAAIASQLAAASAQAHFFRYGEGERLMASVFYLARRGELDGAQWEAWFATLAPPARPATMSQAWLARVHNLKGFLQPLYVSLGETKDSAQRDRMLPFVTKLLTQLD